jgi:hypothetical protein
MGARWRCVAAMREVSADVEKQEMASEEKAGTRREGRATRGEGEKEVEAALCTAAAGEGIAAAAGEEQGSREAQGKKKRGKKRLRVHM